MEIKFSKLSLPSSGVVIIAVNEENIDSDNLVKFTEKSPVKFEGKSGQIVPASHPDDHDLDLVLLVGLGKASAITRCEVRKIGGKIANYLNSIKLDKASVIIDEIESSPVPTAKIAVDIAFGAMLRNYHFNKYLTDTSRKSKNSLNALDIRLEDVTTANEIFNEMEYVKEGVFLARDLVSEPANILTTENYAKECSKLSEYDVKVEILGEKEMEKLGMGALLGVGQGSKSESKLVVMSWYGAEDKDAKPISFVGKGVVFDTGGISLKPSPKMDAMKGDMGGSAAVVGLMKTLARRKAKVNVIGVVGLVENMPDGNAQRPGDIVTSMSGQTIEVLNTDAEGRLVLADALYYTKKTFEPEIIIDLATLTGAIVVTLADVHAGLFTNDDDLGQKLIQAGKNVDEFLWQLPIGKEYDKMIDSPVADIQNIGNGRGAGSITAAQFLKRFVGDTKWAHLDIAGVAMIERDNDFSPKGGTGFGVRLLNNFIKNNYEN